MNKKVISLLLLLILLVSVTVSYAYFNQPSTRDTQQTDTGGDPTDDAVSSEIDLSLLDENQGVEIGDMI
jgi:type II secretory pathway component PulC